MFNLPTCLRSRQVICNAAVFLSGVIVPLQQHWQVFEGVGRSGWCRNTSIRGKAAWGDWTPPYLPNETCPPYLLYLPSKQNYCSNSCQKNDHSFLILGQRFPKICILNSCYPTYFENRVTPCFSHEMYTVRMHEQNKKRVTVWYSFRRWGTEDYGTVIGFIARWEERSGGKVLTILQRLEQISCRLHSIIRNGLVSARLGLAKRPYRQNEVTRAELLLKFTKTTSFTLF